MEDLHGGTGTITIVAHQAPPSPSFLHWLRSSTPMKAKAEQKHLLEEHAAARPLPVSNESRAHREPLRQGEQAPPQHFQLRNARHPDDAEPPGAERLRNKMTFIMHPGSWCVPLKQRRCALQHSMSRGHRCWRGPLPRPPRRDLVDRSSADARHVAFLVEELSILCHPGKVRLEGAIAMDRAERGTQPGGESGGAGLLNVSAEVHDRLGQLRKRDSDNVRLLCTAFRGRHGALVTRETETTARAVDPTAPRHCCHLIGEQEPPLDSRLLAHLLLQLSVGAMAL